MTIWLPPDILSEVGRCFMRIFDNPGSKIRTVVSVLFVLEVILCVVLGLICWLGIGFEFDFFIGFIAALAITAILVILSWIYMLFLGAYGDMCRNLAKQTEILQRIEGQLASMEKKGETQA